MSILDGGASLTPHLLSPAMLARADTGGKWEMHRHHAVMNRALMDVPFVKGARIIINMPYRHGKQIDKREEVPTPNGWRRHGDLRAGDLVYSPDGIPVEVEAVGADCEQDCNVLFSDGSGVRCHENHEWLVFDRASSKWRVMETKQIEGRALLNQSRCTLQVGNSGVLSGTYRELPVHPYALGAWLGDGTTGKGVICWSEENKTVYDAVVACGYASHAPYCQKETGVWYAIFPGLRDGLRKAGVFEEKRVPDEYLTAETWQREELLAGLMDTDGCLTEDKGGYAKYRFVNTNRRLIDAVVELARSLGFRPNVYTSPACESSSGIVGRKDVMTVSFQAVRSLPCRLERKRPKKCGKVEYRGIVAVERIEKSAGNCIQVEGGMYLVGRSLIPTHNSELASHYFPAWMLLLFPQTQILLASNELTLATTWGAKVKDTIDRFGPEQGVLLKEDTQAKGEWKIACDRGAMEVGGMVCKGLHGTMVGRTADCMVGETMIRTEIGMVRIDDLCKMQYKPAVLSFNHATGRTEWRRVVATRVARAEEVVEIQTVRGNVIRCTAEHRVWAGGAYTNAGSVSVGQTLNALPDVSGLEVAAQRRLHGVPDSAVRRRHRVRVVRQNHKSSSLRNKQVPSARLQPVLLAGMRQERQKYEMLRVRQVGREERTQVLPSLPTAEGASPKNPRPEGLRSLRGHIPPTVASDRVLLSLLCEQDAFSEDDRDGQFALQDGDELRELVSVDASADSGARRAPLYQVRFGRQDSPPPLAKEDSKLFKPLHPPHQRAPGGQPPRQSGDDLRRLPQESSQFVQTDDVVRMVRRVRTGGVAVYDLQVEGNSNFFAGNLLVHNCFIIDDPIKDHEQALSPIVLESQWQWFKTVVEGRVTNDTSIIVVMTRWSKFDLCGRILAEAKATGEKWNVIKFKALAEEDDPLGRKPGEPLWEAKVSRQLLEMRKLTNKWFPANYQQEPPDEEGAHFRPRPNVKAKLPGWPKYKKIATNAWSLEPHGEARKIYMDAELLLMVTVDWAYSVKQTADFSAIGVFGLTPDGRLLILDMTNRRLRLEELAPEIAIICRTWRPHLCGIESGHPTLSNDCRRFSEIPEVRWLKTESKDKLRRALPAIVLAENGRVFLPERQEPWLEPLLDQLASFTGIADEHDDQADCLSYACLLAQQLRPNARRHYQDHGALLLTEGREIEGGQRRPQVGFAGRGYNEAPWSGKWDNL